MKLMRRIGGQTACEFKGAAAYFDILETESSTTPVVKQSAWTYESTSTKAIEGRVAFYLKNPLVATVDGEQAKPQAGDFYGGWITSDVVGPFKGEPGTRFW